MTTTVPTIVLTNHTCATCGAPNADYAVQKKEKRSRRVVKGQRVTAQRCQSTITLYFCDNECANQHGVEALFL